MSSLEEVLNHVAYTIGTDPTSWGRWSSNGWGGEIEAAFLDSILSVQARYGDSADSGVRLRVKYWRDERARSHGAGVVLDDLVELARFDRNAVKLAEILRNRQTLSGSGGGRPLKALAVAQAARLFVDRGIRHSDQIESTSAQKTLWCSVDGLGPATWHYVLMLLGKPDVKADTMITRFVSNATGSVQTGEAVRLLIIEAAKALDVSATELDYAIWSWQRRQTTG